MSVDGPEGAAAELTEILVALTDVGGWRPVGSVDGVVLTRGWSEGSVDTVVFTGVESAFAQREDGAGRAVWRVRGSAARVKAEVEGLGPPAGSDGVCVVVPGGVWDQ